MKRNQEAVLLFTISFTNEYGLHYFYLSRKVAVDREKWNLVRKSTMKREKWITKRIGICIIFSPSRKIGSLCNFYVKQKVLWTCNSYQNVSVSPLKRQCTCRSDQKESFPLPMWSTYVRQGNLCNARKRGSTVEVSRMKRDRRKRAGVAVWNGKKPYSILPRLHGGWRCGGQGDVRT